MSGLWEEAVNKFGYSHLKNFAKNKFQGNST